ncbi:hypothetical protein, partial [Mycoplasmoides pirum]|uniref:hypothetical protein n=1 Tax=Mycoplasmoides pirum TaxID=2122 RepID=UPI000561CE88
NYVADGWKNAASQKIIAFSPQLTNNVFESSNGRFNQVVATLVLRGYVYSIAYDFELLQGVRLVPIANKSYNVNTNAIANSSSGLNNFRHLLSISYFDNTWAITYQNTKVETYVLKYSKDVNYSWSFSLESSLSANTKLSKNITYLNNNFLFITQNKEIKVANTISKTQNFLNDDSSINSNAGIWGTIKPVDQKYLTDNNLLDKTPNEIASNQDLLKQLIDYSGGWSANSEGIPTVEPLIINIRTSRSTIEFDVAIKFINNKYYTSAPVDINVYPDIVQNSSLNIPSFKYDGFAVLAPWVMPAIIGGVVFLVLLFITIGVLVTLSLHKNKRMMQKGFASSNKKIDTLTTAVGSVY